MGKKTFFLTGSARGLGRSIATAILEAGHQLVATARRPEQLADLAAQFGPRLLPVALDVNDPDAATRAVQAGIAAFGRIDVAVNNAGYGNMGAVEDMPMDAIARMMDTNFLGSVRVIKAVLPAMRAQGGGRIIQVSSIGARVGIPGVAGYFASKWAISGFLESLALEVGPLGIQVTAVEPAGMKTDFAEDTSMTIYPSSPAYAATAGATAAMVKSPGYPDLLADPAGIADVVLRVAALDTPPVRLLLGGHSYELAKGAEQARMAADARWKTLSLAADTAPGAVPA